MAHSAPPVLASALLSTHNEYNVPGTRKRKRVGTGCAAIDDMLDGGITYGKGEVCTISGTDEVKEGMKGISLHLLASHLLSSPTSHASVIDTTGTFDVLTLYEVIITRLPKDRDLNTTRMVANDHLQRPNQGRYDDDDGALAEEANKTLDRVKIMRVFDFMGVVEAVGEVREGLEAKTRRRDGADAAELPKEREGRVRRTESRVIDSEDEDEDMLFGGGASPSPTRHEADDTPEPADSSNEQDNVGMIIIDNTTQVVSPLIKANYVQGHALLTSFLRTLNHLTHTRNLCTILLNGAISPRTPSSATQNPSDSYQAASSTHDPVTLSIFASTTARPALGRTFPYFLDLHLFVSSVPKRRRDAEAFYGRKGVGGRIGIEFASVVEVLADRWEGRIGRWAAFTLEREIWS